MTWLISDEARKHRAFREVWVAYLLGGLYLLLGLYTEISEQNYSALYDAQQKWLFIQQNIYSYGATLTAFLLAVGLPRLVCCEREYRTDALVGTAALGRRCTWRAKTAFTVLYCVAVVFIIGAASLLVNGGAFGFEGALSPVAGCVYFTDTALPPMSNLAYCALQYGFLFLGALYFAGFYSDRRHADTAGGPQPVSVRRKLSAVLRVFRCRASAAGVPSRAVRRALSVRLRWLSAAGELFVGLSIFMVGRMETGPAGDWDDPSGIFHLLENLAEEGDDMKTELTRYFRNSLYWFVLVAGLSVRAVLAYFDSRFHSDAFWSLSAEFWNKIGSVTLGFLVLLVLIRLFSADRETGVFPVINSTAYGRITLFRNRLIAGSIAASAGAVLLAAGNHALSILISGRLPQPDGWNHAWFRSTAIVLIGTIGFFLFAAFVCDSLKNQPAAMCICGVPFAFSYFINVAVLKKFEFFWFVRYGFFAEWMRGRRIGVTPGVWGVWYALLLGGLLLVAIHQRKERKEL